MEVELPQYLPVEWVDREEIEPNDWNPNEMDAERLEGLKQSIEDNGWTQPIVVHAEEKYIIDGEQRWTVAKELEDPDLTPVDMPADYVPVFGITVDDDHARVATVQHNRARGTISSPSAEEFLSELRDLDVLETAADRITFNTDSLNELLDEFGESETPDVDLGEPTEPDIVDDDSDTDSDESDTSESESTPELREFPSDAARNSPDTRVLMEVLSEKEYEIVMEALGDERRGQSFVNLVRYVLATDSLDRVESR